MASRTQPPTTYASCPAAVSFSTTRWTSFGTWRCVIVTRWSLWRRENRSRAGQAAHRRGLRRTVAGSVGGASRGRGPRWILEHGRLRGGRQRPRPACRGVRRAVTYRVEEARYVARNPTG